MIINNQPLIRCRRRPEADCAPRPGTSGKFVQLSQLSAQLSSFQGHPIIFLSSLNFVTRVHRALSALRKRFFERRVSHLIRTLHLIVTDIRRTFFSVAHHPLSRLQKFSERGPEYCPPRGPLASTLLIGVLSLAYRTARSIHLRAGSAVSQHGILHAEGSFWS